MKNLTPQEEAEEFEFEWRAKNMQYSIPSYRCSRCFQKITNPICHECYYKHLSTWLRERKSLKKERASIKRSLKFIHKIEPNSELKCIICKKRNVELCTYCYFFQVESILVRKQQDEKLIEDFNEMFNYKTYHEEYT